MQVRNYLGLAVLPLFFAFCPSLSAASYSWNFTGSGGSNCAPVQGHPNACSSTENSMTFTSNNVKVTVSAWYVNGNGTLASATLGQYSSGLGVCSKGENCNVSNNQQLADSEGIENNEFLLFQFSAPVDPTSINLKSTTTGGLGVSYWLGNTTNPSLDLTNMDMTTSLSTLFGSGSSQINGNAGTGSTGAINFGGVPTIGVNAILFGARYGGSGSSDFDVLNMSGTSVPGSVPEPASIFLLFTVAVAVLGLRRRAQQLHH